MSVLTQGAFKSSRETPGAFSGTVADAVLTLKFSDAGIQQPGQRVRLGVDFHFRFQLVQQHGGIAPPHAMHLSKSLNGGQDGVRLFLRGLASEGNKLPHFPLFVKAEVQLRVGYLPPSHIQCGGGLHPGGLLQDKSAIGASQQAGRAGDHVEGVGGPGLAGVVDYQHRHQKAVGDFLQGADRLVVAGVIVLLLSGLADTLEGVDNRQLHMGMGGEEVCKLFLEALADIQGLGRQPDAAGLAAADIVQPLLHPLEGILQADVEGAALLGFQSPDRLALADLVRQPQHQPGLAHLGRSGEDVDALPNQAIDQCAGWGIGRVQQFLRRDHIQFKYFLFFFRHSKFLSRHPSANTITLAETVGRAAKWPGWPPSCPGWPLIWHVCRVVLYTEVLEFSSELHLSL